MSEAGEVERIEKTEAVLTPEEQELSLRIERLVLDAIPAACKGCTAADLAPSRIGRAVVREKRPLSVEGAEAVAARFRDCHGLFDGMCHLGWVPEEDR